MSPAWTKTRPLRRETLPVGVAAIKAKLFGSHEQEATRYPKEGVLSPKHTHPVNTTFSDQYFSQAPREVSPNINNNNSASEDDSLASDPVLRVGVAGGVASPDEEALVKDTLLLAGSGGAGREPPKEAGGRKEEEAVTTMAVPEDPAEPDQNLYDSPWEQKSVSKYKVIGVRRRSGSASPAQAKEKTPPPTAPKRLGPKIQIAEVSVEETPRPLTTAELRNVHSLERKHSNEKAGPPKGQSSVSPPMGGVQSESSLLASISDTLQVTSRYGSDSLLNNGSDSPSGAGTAQGGGALTRWNSGGEVKMSSRGELEKIRAAHRKEATPTGPRPFMLSQASAKQHSSPQLFAPSSHAPKPSAGGIGIGSPNHAPFKSGGSQPTTPVKSASKLAILGGGVGVARSQPQLYPQTASTLPGHASSRSPAAGGGVVKGIGLVRSPRGIAASVEGLQRRPDTHVTYDAQTQAHIFRSLV